MGSVITTILSLVGAFFVSKAVVDVFSVFVKMRKKSKAFKQAQKTKEEMLKNGEQHKWVELPAAGGGTMLVCEKTGWCPARDSFLTKSAIEGLKRIQENDKAYLDFYNDKMNQIAEDFNITVDQLRSIMVKTTLIKTEFHVELMEKSLKEYRKVQ